MKRRSLGIGWRSKVALKRATYSISINKLVAEGCAIKKGEYLHCYLEEEQGRKLIVIYLDGKARSPVLAPSKRNVLII